MKRVRNIFNYVSPAGEINRDPSETVPDQSMSMSEILRRFASGLPIGGSRLPVFDEDDDTPDPRTLDLSERQDLAEKYQKDIEAINEEDARIKAENAEKRATESKRRKRFDDYIDSIDVNKADSAKEV